MQNHNQIDEECERVGLALDRVKFLGKRSNSRVTSRIHRFAGSVPVRVKDLCKDCGRYSCICKLKEIIGI